MYTITTMALWDQHIKEEDTKCVAVSAQREGFFNIGSGQVGYWTKYRVAGSGSGSGPVGVSKNTIGYFRVSFLLSGISGYVGYFRVFLGLPIYTRVIF